MPRPKPVTPELSQNPQGDAERAVRVLRMQWFGFLAAMFAIFFCGGLFATQQTLNASIQLQKTLVYVMMGAFLLGPMIGFFLRMQTYKSGYIVDRVTPVAYVKANQILYGIFIAVTVAMAVALAATGAFTQCLLVFVCTLVLHALNFPNGKPLQPAPPALLNS